MIEKAFININSLFCLGMMFYLAYKGEPASHSMAWLAASVAFRNRARLIK